MNLPKLVNSVSTIVVLLAACFVPAQAQTKPAAPSSPTSSQAPSTGQRIGTIIKDAIGTAFPGVSGIGGLIDAIWSHKPNGGNNVNKSQLQTAVTNSKDDIKTSVVAEAQKNLAPVSEVADELQIVSQFGVPTTTASEDLLKMSFRLRSGKALSDDDWTQERADWEEAKAELATIKGLDTSKIQDLWLRDKLFKIQQTNVGAVNRIDTELKAKTPNAERLRDLVAQAYSTLQDISAAVGFEVSNLQMDLKSLASWAKGAAGEENELSDEAKKYVKFLNEKYR